MNSVTLQRLALVVIMRDEAGRSGRLLDSVRPGVDEMLVLDSDEWLVAGGEALQALRSTPPDFVGALQLRDQFDMAAGRSAESIAWVSRVLPGAVRCAGRVHEQPVHGLPVRRLALVVGHDGHIDERLAAKRGRNRRLLERALAEAPWWLDLMSRRLFARKCLGRHADAVDFAQAQMAAGAESPDFFFIVGDELLDVAALRPEQADELLPMIEAAWPC